MINFSNTKKHSDGSKSCEIYLNDQIIGKLWKKSSGLINFQEFIGDGKSAYTELGTISSAEAHAYLTSWYDTNEDDSQFHTGGKPQDDDAVMNRIVHEAEIAQTIQESDPFAGWLPSYEAPKFYPKLKIRKESWVERRYPNTAAAQTRRLLGY